MTVNTNHVQFTTAELGARTQVLIAEMDRTGTKIRRDEWRFEGGIQIRINYAHREQRIHLSHKPDPKPATPNRLLEVVSVNIDSTNPLFPSLEELLAKARSLASAR